jgi:hypothetical protein
MTKMSEQLRLVINYGNGGETTLVLKETSNNIFQAWLGADSYVVFKEKKADEDQTAIRAEERTGDQTGA